MYLPVNMFVTIDNFTNRLRCSFNQFITSSPEIRATIYVIRDKQANTIEAINRSEIKHNIRYQR